MYFSIQRMARGSLTRNLKVKKWATIPACGIPVIRWGVQTKLPDFFGSGNKLKYNSVSDFKNNLKLMSTVPEQLKDVETLLRIGVENGMTYAKESIEPSRLQFESLQVLKPGDSKFYLQFKNIGKILPGVDKSTANSIKAKARSVIWKKVLPAFKRHKHLQ